MFRCILTVLSFTMSIPLVWVSFALQKKRDPIHWEYCAQDVTQVLFTEALIHSVLCCEQYSISKVMLSEELLCS